MSSRFALAVAAALVSASMLAPAALAARDFYNGPDPRCSWYKQQAMNEGRKARATAGKTSEQHRARSDAYWKQYNACLRGNDW